MPTDHVPFQAVPVTFVLNEASGRVLVDVQELDNYLVALRGEMDPEEPSTPQLLLQMLHTWLEENRSKTLREASATRNHIT